MKLLISLIGFNEDFNTNKDNGVVINPSGFSVKIHNDIFEQEGFNKHIILYTEDISGLIANDIKRRNYYLTEHLNEFYPSHRFELLSSGIDKTELQNFKAIESRLRSFIQSIDASDELHVLAGTGPTAFSMAWFTLHLSMKKRFRLHLLQRSEYTADGSRSLLIEIKPYINTFLDDSLREYHTSKKLPEIYKDEIVEEEYEKAFAFAQTDMNILILGETGCGKDKMAEFIYDNAILCKKNYKAINCASLPDDVLYSELFGHEKGAFTGANDKRIGFFEECNGGTLFLDEIGDISVYMQQSLLRAIENKEIKRLGSNDIQKNIDVRIIAATNVNLYQKCKEGKFRWDLYYRLSNPEIILKNYRSRTAQQRKQAINHFLKLLNRKWGRKLTFSKEATNIIENYSFPGNFREIFNTLNSLFPLKKEVIEPEHLPARFKLTENEMDESYESALKRHCIHIYEKYKYDLAKTTTALGYKNSTQVKNKLIEWGAYYIEDKVDDFK